MERLSKYAERTVKVLLMLMIFFMMSNLQAQTAPTNGKKVLEVTNKYENEYSFEVFKSMYAAPYEYHMKRLPKKLEKYGFTNVVITELGSVQPVANKKGSLSLGLAYIQSGSTVGTAVNKVVNDVDKSKFQVNFTSDQGTFKVRLSDTATGIKYIIAQ